MVKGCSSMLVLDVVLLRLVLSATKPTIHILVRRTMYSQPAGHNVCSGAVAVCHHQIASIDKASDH